jgi:uncharacterized membrane protein YfhO
VATYKADGEQQNYWNVTTYEPYVIDLGTLSPEQKVEVNISAESAVSGNIHVVRLDEEALSSAVAAVREHGLTVTESTSTSLKGTVNAPTDGVLFLSIPYDSGWTATVDGKPAATFPVDKDVEGTDGAMLAVELSAGQHTVALSYHAPGQRIGIVISLVSAGMIVALWVVERTLARRRASRSTPPETPEAPPSAEAQEDTFTEFLHDVESADEAPAPETAAEPAPDESTQEASAEE